MSEILVIARLKSHDGKCQFPSGILQGIGSRLRLLDGVAEDRVLTRLNQPDSEV